MTPQDIVWWYAHRIRIGQEPVSVWDQLGGHITWSVEGCGHRVFHVLDCA